jgi:hypothetical protein
MGPHPICTLPCMHYKLMAGLDEKLRCRCALAAKYIFNNCTFDITRYRADLAPVVSKPPEAIVIISLQ